MPYLRELLTMVSHLPVALANDTTETARGRVTLMVHLLYQGRVVLHAVYCLSCILLASVISVSFNQAWSSYSTCSIKSSTSSSVSVATAALCLAKRVSDCENFHQLFG
jgi:hypothetical protein